MKATPFFGALALLAAVALGLGARLRPETVLERGLFAAALVAAAAEALGRLARRARRCEAAPVQEIAESSDRGKR
jgi:hypothetical protein